MKIKKTNQSSKLQFQTLLAVKRLLRYQKFQNKQISKAMKKKSLKPKHALNILNNFMRNWKLLTKMMKKSPGPFRSIVVYIISSLSVIFGFNRPDNLSLFLTLALFTVPQNQIYQIILEQPFVHLQKAVRVLGLYLELQCLITCQLFCCWDLSKKLTNGYIYIFVSSSAWTIYYILPIVSDLIFHAFRFHQISLFDEFVIQISYTEMITFLIKRGIQRNKLYQNEFLIFYIIDLPVKLSLKYYFLIIEMLNQIRTQNDWKDTILDQTIETCQKNVDIMCIGVQQSLHNIYWRKTYNLPHSHKLGVFIEYQVSGIWNDYKLQVFANNIMLSNKIISLTDTSRQCSTKYFFQYFVSFLYESYIYINFIKELDQLLLEIRVDKVNVGLFIQNIIIDSQTQSGRNQIIPFFNYIPDCRSGSGLQFYQYYCKCQEFTVYQIDNCKSVCDQNYLYDPSSNSCYLKENCNLCSGLNTVLKCNSGFYSYLESDPVNSNCVARCPLNFIENQTTFTCTDMKTHLEKYENQNCKILFNIKDPVDHYFFYKNTADFLHFFTYNSIFVQVTSIPKKVQERSFVYHKGKFVAGSYETFQSQTILLQLKVKHSQYKLRFRAIGHFIDFIPQSIDIYINGVHQQMSTLIQSQQNEQKQDQDYIAYFDYYWIRTEYYPVSYNNIIFQIQQPKINGIYQGYFYLEDINIYQFRCQNSCNTCFTINYCTPCLNPANKNPDCTCQKGYYLQNDICIECPTYCQSCTQVGICDDCKLITKRINLPNCNQCPNQYYLKLNEDNCQQCIYGCNICINQNQCNQCLQGYYKNNDQICVLQCTNGYFNNNIDINNPICTLCDNNCLTCQDISTKCITCQQNYKLINNHCYICDNGYYLDDIQCLQCINGCKICQNNQICQICKDNYYLNQTTGQCVDICDSNYYGNDLTQTCDQCHNTCLTCIGSEDGDCLSCSGGLILNVKNMISGYCSPNCISGYYPVDTYCAKCWKGCSSCNNSTQACLVCAANYYRLITNKYCYQICPNGYYNNQVNYICSPCDLNCKTCNGSSKSNCLSCTLPFTLYQNQCLSTCPDGYGNVNAECLECTQNCKQCFGVAPNQCTTCSKGYYILNNQCYYKCPTSFIGIRPQYICRCIYPSCAICNTDEFYYNNACYQNCPSGLYGYNNLCIKCDITCQSCFTEGTHSCLSCQSPLILFNDQCVTQCVGNTFHNTVLNICQECHSSCLACNGPNNNNCTACQIKVLTSDSTCESSCPVGQYVVVAERKCYRCDSSCLTCYGGENQNCLTCSNLFYQYTCLDTCPANTSLSTNKLQCNSNTSIGPNTCSYKCLTCKYIPRFCLQCYGNRIANPPNCDCDNGYYDDGSSSDCQKCSNKCLNCHGQSNLCTHCKGDRLLPNCTCPQYYYDDGHSVQCIKCQDNCQTCSQLGCITCLNNRINPPNCICSDGYYEAYSEYCLECAKKCITCSVTDQLCQECSSIRINPPICSCPGGYFQNSNEDCQQCNETCIDCDFTGCLSCFGNRVGPNQGVCSCAILGISRINIGSVYCTDCSLGVPYFGLNDEFTGFTIDFGLQTDLSSDVDINDICGSIFQKSTLQKLGSDPVCDAKLNVLFGENPSIKVGDIIQLKPQFILKGCTQQFQAVLTMPLSIPSSINQFTHKPKVQFSDYQKPNVCAPTSIKFIKKFYNGGQKFKIISWKQIQPATTNPLIDSILKSSVTENSEEIKFPKRLLQAGVLYQFSVTLTSFANLQNTILITFTPVSYATVIFRQISDVNEFKRNAAITLESELAYYNCIEENIPVQQLFYKINLQHSDFQINGTINEEIKDGFQTNITLQFDSYYFSFKNPYTFVFYTKLTRTDYVVETKNQFQIYIISTPPSITINGGNRMIGYTEDLILNTTISDIDLNETEAASQSYQCYWTCTDVATQADCLNQFNTTIIFDNKCDSFMKGRTYSPYQVMTFQVIILKDSISFSSKVTIQVIEIDLPHLIVLGLNADATYNYYDEFLSKLIYPNINPDVLRYAGAVIYDQVVQEVFFQQYLEFKFSLINYFASLTPIQGTQVKLRFSIYDPRFVMPSVNTQGLIMNIPPFNCSIQFNSNFDSFVEFLDEMNFSITNCQDIDFPLLYSVSLYPNNTIYQEDLIKSHFYNSIDIIPQQYSNNFIFTLPYLNKDPSLLIIYIQDSKGGISNITQKVYIKEYANLTTGILDNFLNQQYSIDYLLIVYGIITKRLSNLDLLQAYKEQIFTKLIYSDTNQTLTNNQTYELYRSISIIAEQNCSVIFINQTFILNQLSYRISLAYEQLLKFHQSQQTDQLSSIDNIEKQTIIKNYYTFAHILSSFLQCRVVRNVSSSDIIDQFYTIINNLLEVSVANQPLYKIITKSAILTFGNLTSKFIYQETGTTLESDNFTIQDKYTDTQLYNSKTNLYKYSIIRYIDNPYYIEIGFPKNSSGFQSVDPIMIIYNSIKNETKLSSPIQFKFPTLKQLPANTTTSCIAKVNQTNWSADVCKTITKDGKTICQCNQLSPTSIMESLEFIQDKATQIYSLDTLQQFATFPFYETIVFYFYLTLTSLYIYLAFWGMRVDNKLFSKIQHENDTVENLKQDQCIKNQQSRQLNTEGENEIIFTSTIFKTTQRKAKNVLKLKPSIHLLTQLNLNHNKIDDLPLNSVTSNCKQQEEIPNQKSHEHIENSAKGAVFESPLISATSHKQHTMSSFYPDGNKNEQKVTKFKAYVEYLKFFHQILQVIYKDDESKPRALRSTILYTSIIGSLTILFVFNKSDNLSLTLTLSMITAPLNKVYQIILEKLLAHKKKTIRVFGAIFMMTVGGLMSYTMLAGLLLLGSVETANKWTYIFIASFSLDNLLYTPIQLVLQYCIHLGLIRSPALQSLLNKIIDEKGKQFIEALFKRAGLI